jgi:fatty acid desaturase
MEQKQSAVGVGKTRMELCDMNDSINSKYINRFCWPLLTEWVFALVFYFGAIAMSITGSISLVVGSVTVCLSYFALFNSMHAAAHRHFSGGLKKYRWIDESIGRITGVLTQVPYRPFAKIHIAHHKNTGVFGADPDFVPFPSFRLMNKYYFLSYLLQVGSIIPIFNKFMMKRLPKFIRQRLEFRKDKIINRQLAITLLIVLTTFAAGYGSYGLWLFYFPFLLQRYMLMVGFMWLPHVSGFSGRYVNTRSLITPIINRISFMKLIDFHAEHHLYPSVPSSYLRKLHFEIIDELDENKVVYVGRFNKKPWKPSRAGTVAH